MKQNVNPVNGLDASVALMNAMAARCPDDDIIKLFGIEVDTGAGPTVQVELIVNGISVPFVETFTEAWQELSAKIERNIQNKALELVKGTKLAALLQTLENAEWEIEQELRKASL